MEIRKVGDTIIRLNDEGIATFHLEYLNTCGYVRETTGPFPKEHSDQISLEEYILLLEKTADHFEREMKECEDNV